MPWRLPKRAPACTALSLGEAPLAALPLAATPLAAPPLAERLPE